MNKFLSTLLKISGLFLLIGLFCLAFGLSQSPVKAFKDLALKRAHNKGQVHKVFSSIDEVEIDLKERQVYIEESKDASVHVYYQDIDPHVDFKQEGKALVMTDREKEDTHHGFPDIEIHTPLPFLLKKIAKQEQAIRIQVPKNLPRLKLQVADNYNKLEGLQIDQLEVNADGFMAHINIRESTFKKTNLKGLGTIWYFQGRQEGLVVDPNFSGNLVFEKTTLANSTFTLKNYATVHLVKIEGKVEVNLQYHDSFFSFDEAQKDQLAIKVDQKEGTVLSESISFQKVGDKQTIYEPKDKQASFILHQDDGQVRVEFGDTRNIYITED